ncbi:MAG: hypothetical protein JXA00_06355 [Candidatus Thermoplasmatota archaeon]|nr:hypothetical protein [Candidatus Thermoplasmatota archaeon]
MMLVVTSIAVNAESDGTGDVLYYDGPDWHDWDWDVTNKPNVDIVDISFIAGDRLTLSLTVSGSINSAHSFYHVWYNTSDAYYHLFYLPGIQDEVMVAAFPLNFDEWTIEELQNYTPPTWEASITNGNTITATVDWVTEDHAMVNYFGWAQEWAEEGDQWLEFWIDYAPDSYSSYGSYEDYYGTGNGDTNGPNGDDVTQPGGTPGFEAVAVLAALGVALILLKRRK